MLPKKKRKLFANNNSIPIHKTLYSRKYLVFYSIPLGCMVALLLVVNMMINLDSGDQSNSNKVNAITIGDSVDDSTISGELVDKNYDGNGRNIGSVVGSENVAMIDGEEDYGIMTLAAPTLGLTVTNSDKVINIAQGAGTAYSDHLVTITGTEVTNYALNISTSSANLTQLSGINGADITGAEGKTGNTMANNRWGYTVTEEGTASSSYGGLIYNSVPITSTTIASGNATSSNTLNVKKKIVIAARFGEDAAPGTYRQSINLSVVADPNATIYKITYNSNGGGVAPSASMQNSLNNSAVFTLPAQGSMVKSGYSFVGWSTSSTATAGSAADSSYTVYKANPQITLYAVWKAVPAGAAIWSNGTNSGITNMQDIETGFCSSSIPAGSTITLKDNRGSSPINYKIIKMKNGTCWMAENLRLMNITISSTDSDMTSGSFTIPASSISGFTSDDQSSAKAYYNKDTVYGAYYNWYTATAGSGTDSVAYGSADASICPKNWKLPAYSGTDSFDNIINGTNGFNDGGWTVLNGKNGHKYGYDSNDAFWPAAGYVDNGSLVDVNTRGGNWSRKARNLSTAYRLNFTAVNVQSQAYSGRYFGFPVRCVAEY